MKLCKGDEVKINPEKKDELYFINTIQEIEEDREELEELNLSKLIRSKGKILETDFCKKLQCWTYLVQYTKINKEKVKTKEFYWFKEEELLLT